MVNNIDRSEWAREAVQVFADRTMAGFVGSEAITDLVCDIGHFAEIELGYSQDQVLDLFRIGIGSWSAERSDPDEEPCDNDTVEILIRPPSAPPPTSKT